MKINAFIFAPAVLVLITVYAVGIGTLFVAGPGFTPGISVLLALSPFAACALFLLAFEAITGHKTLFGQHVFIAALVTSPTVLIPMISASLESAEKWTVALPILCLTFVPFTLGMFFQVGYQIKQEQEDKAKEPAATVTPSAT